MSLGRRLIEVSMNYELQEEYKEFKHMLGSGALRILLNIKMGESALDGVSEQLCRDNAKFHNNVIDIAKCYKFLKYQLSQFGLIGIHRVDKEQIDITRLFKHKFDFRVEDSEVNFLIPDAWAVLRLPNLEDRRKVGYRIFSNFDSNDTIKLSEVFTNLEGFNDSNDRFEWVEPSGKKYLLYKERMSGFSNYASDYLANYYVEPFSNDNVNNKKTPKILTQLEIESRLKK